MTDTNKQAGAGRSPGPSVGDILASDHQPAPASLLGQQYAYLGDEDIDCRRYTSQEFARRETERLWSRCWQWACREEHLQDAGDSYVYDIGPYSVLIARNDSGEIQAFVNSCTHRGTRLFAAEGSQYVSQFTCPFHGWSWGLDGVLKNVPGRWDFPHVCENSHSLQAVLCDTWGGFVFINLDRDARPLADYLGVMPEHFQDFPLQRRRISAHVQKILPANWKAAQEAFMEAYHNFETHNAPNGGNTQYDIFGKYISRFIHNVGTYSPQSLADYPGGQWREPPLSENEQLQMLSVLGLEITEVPEGDTARRIAAQGLREKMGKAVGADLSAVSDTLMLDSIEYHMFPNMFFFAGFGIPMVYRFRPNGEDVDTCIFDVLLLELLADGAEHPEPPEPIMLDVEQSYTEAEVLGWLAPVYDEDTGNLDMQQRGLKASRKAGITLGNYQEARIRRVHLTLDEFMAGE